MTNEFYQTPQEIVSAYYAGQLQKDYPILSKAIEILIDETIQCREDRKKWD